MREDWPAHRQNKMDAHAKGGRFPARNGEPAVVVGRFIIHVVEVTAAARDSTGCLRDIEACVQSSELMMSFH